MYLLMRRISAYTGPDVLLGVYATLADAEAARTHYARVRESDTAADPWKDQGYKPDMVVSRDLEIEQLPGDSPVGSVVFVVSDHSDGFGQEVRKLDSIHTTAAAAAARVEELDDTVEDTKFPFPHYAVVDPVIVGSLHSDLQDDQPQPGWRQKPPQALHVTRPRNLFSAAH